MLVSGVSKVIQLYRYSFFPILFLGNRLSEYLVEFPFLFSRSLFVYLYIVGPANSVSSVVSTLFSAPTAFWPSSPGFSVHVIFPQDVSGFAHKSSMYYCVP